MSNPAIVPRIYSNINHPNIWLERLDVDKYVVTHHTLRINEPFYSEMIKYQIVAEVADTLSYLHNHDIIHNYVCSEAIFYDHLKRKTIVKGFQHIRKIPPGQIGIVFSTLSIYSAPETVMSKMSYQKSDIWSFGLLIFELFTGINYKKVSQNVLIAALIQTIDSAISKSLGFESLLCARKKAREAKKCGFSLDHPLLPKYIQILLRKIFVLDYRKRPSAAEILKDLGLQRSQIKKLFSNKCKLAGEFLIQRIIVYDWIFDLHCKFYHNENIIYDTYHICSYITEYYNDVNYRLFVLAAYHVALYLNNYKVSTEDLLEKSQMSRYRKAYNNIFTGLTLIWNPIITTLYRSCRVLCKSCTPRLHFNLAKCYYFGLVNQHSKKALATDCVNTDICISNLTKPMKHEFSKTLVYKFYGPQNNFAN